MNKKIIGICIGMLLIANVSFVLGKNISEIPTEQITETGPNLAPNPSFEEGDAMPTGWTFDPNSTGIYHWDSTYAFSGEKSIGVLNLTYTYPDYITWITTDFIPVNCTVRSYMLSAWFKFVDIPTYQFAWIRILYYNADYQLAGYSGHGLGVEDTEWHQIVDYTGYGEGIHYVKLELGQRFNWPNEPNPLNEIRFDDIYFGVWNTAPNKPYILGFTFGKVRTLYDYTINASDPDNDNVSYIIDWGDNTTTTTPFYTSGEEIDIPHIWGEKGEYYVKAKAIDEHGAKSAWTILKVTMPYSINIPFLSFMEKIFERFPNAFPLLRHLMRY